MIYLSAGHHNADPGAIGNGYKEADLTKRLRDMVAAELARQGAKYILDKDSETLAQYISRIQPGSGSVLCEIHFNAGPETATGAEVIYKEGAGPSTRAMAAEMSAAIAARLGIHNRGAKDETTSHRGRLGILHTAAGISVLPEICFISSQSDVMKYVANEKDLAKDIARLLIKYEAIFL